MNFTEFINFLICCCVPKFKKYTWKKRFFQDVDTMTIKDEKLINCSIASSHNSILGQMQICARASLYPLYKALNYNFREIELDVFNLNGEYVVGHGRNNNCIATNTIPLEDCLQVIVEYGWKDTNMPLFISLELNAEFTKELSEIIFDYLGHRLYANKTKQLKDCTISELKNKVIILSNKHLDFEPKYKLYNMSVNGVPNGLQDLVRIYPDNKVLSTNYNFYKFLPHANFISINSCYKDKYYYQYIGYYNKGIVKRGGSFIF